MTTEANFKRWSKILGRETLQISDPIKFKWTDLRSPKSCENRKTWTYGYVTDLHEGLGYHVRVVKGGTIRDGVLVTFKDVKLWFPRK